MAFTEKQDYQTEVTAPYSVIRVRRADIVLKDGEEVGRTYHRHQIVPCSIDESDNMVNTDISKEAAQVQAICNAVFTTDVKNTYRDHLIANKPK
tara:strand:- start:225 stop:506 length:282 start_codon:yes stop_codon:yes gene_type:complete